MELVSHSFTVLSSEPLIINLSSTLNLAALTQFVWPQSEYWNLALCDDHIFNDLSSEQLNNLVPLELKETLRTEPTCALKLVTFPCALGVHNLMQWSDDPDAKILPFGWKSTE